MRRRGHALTMPSFTPPPRVRVIKTGPFTLGILQAWPFYWGKRDDAMEAREVEREAAWRAMCDRLRALYPRGQ